MQRCRGSVSQLRRPVASRRCFRQSFPHLIVPKATYYGPPLYRMAQQRNKSETNEGRHHGSGLQGQGNPSSPTMAEATDEIASLRRQALELEPMPPPWVHASYSKEHSERLQLLKKTESLLSLVRESVEKGVISPSGKHGRELSHFLGETILVFSSTPHFEEMERSPFRLCLEILRLLKEWNLDIQPHHYECAVLAASREELWKEAADLFWAQIDPDASGYIPMTTSFKDPVGLYSIARQTQKEGGAATEQVMEAVLKMSMVSPTDQHKYVMAAGVTLGLVGEWDSCIRYLRTSYNSERLGRSLVAAAMHACLLCSRYDEALELYVELLDDNFDAESEWQWGGGSGAIGPLIRDLAMRALGGATLEKGDASSQAMTLFREIEDGGPLSVDGLKGVVTACERDGNWEAAINVLCTVIDKCDYPNWLVAGDDIFDLDTDDNKDPLSWHSEMGGVVASVLRNCNAAGRFGMALFCGRLVDVAMYSMDRSKAGTLSSERGNLTLEESLLPLVVGVRGGEEILTSLMVSLCGVGCSGHAATLYKIAVSAQENFNDANNHGLKRWSDAEQCYGYALSLSTESDPSLGRSWESAHRHIHRITAAAHSISSAKTPLSKEDQEVLASAAAKAMQCCDAAGHAEAGIHLCERLDKALLANASESGAISNLLRRWSGT